MKLRKITVGKKVTINLGDFNNVQPVHVIEAELDEDDDYEEVRKYLKSLVNEHLAEEIADHTDEAEE